MAAICVLCGMAGCSARADQSRLVATETQADTRRIQLEESSLPQGLQFLDEGPREIGEQETIVARFAPDDGLWNADGPYLRIVAHRNTNIAADLAASVAPDWSLVQVGDRTGYYDIDEDTDPRTMDLPEALADLKNPWTAVTWAVDEHVILTVQGKGIPKEQLVDIATRVRFDA